MFSFVCLVNFWKREPSGTCFRTQPNDTKIDAQSCCVLSVFHFYIVKWMYHYLFIHSHINEYLGCFQFLYYQQCCHEHSFPCLILSLRTITVFVHFYPHYPRFCHLVETQRGKKYIFPFTSNLKENKTMG